MKATTKASYKYNKANTVRYNINLNKKTDAHIIEYLADVESKAGTIRAALNKMIAEQNYITVRADDLISKRALMKAFSNFVKRSKNSDSAQVPTWNDAVWLVATMSYNTDCKE